VKHGTDLAELYQWFALCDGFLVTVVHTAGILSRSSTHLELATV